MTEFIERNAYFLDAPIAVVIGCGDLGMACARVLGRRTPLVVVDVSQARLDDAIATLRREGYAAEGHVCDIGDADQVRRLGDMAATRGGVRVLAHVAAVGYSPLGWRNILDVNLFGVHHVARAIGPHIVPGGVAIFMSSTGSRITQSAPAVDDVLDDPFQADFHDRLARAFGHEPSLEEAYHLSKRGMNMLSVRLAAEWGPRQVRSLTVSPGIVDTTMAREGGTQLPVQNADGTERMMTWPEMAARIVPLGRCGTIPEVSAVVEFMASDAASFVTGIDIPVDGGSLAVRQPRGTICG